MKYVTSLTVTPVSVSNKAKDISFVYLSEQDVVRHALVSEIVKAYKK